MIDKNVFQNIKKMKELHLESHINSLAGKKRKVTFVAECEYEKQHIYIVKYKGKFCTTIFNGFVCEYYTDDRYGVVDNFE